MTAIAVILAAGAGRRMGGAAKALLAIDEHARGGRGGDPTGFAGGAGAASPRGISESFLARIAATARAAGVTRAVVVVGAPHAVAVGAAARALGLDVATNGNPARGMASSVAVGFTAAVSRDRYADADIALLWPVDHPHVAPATIERLLAELGAAPDRVAAIPVHAGRGGHPPAIRRALWPALAACGGHSDGARGVIAAAGTAAVRIEVDDDGVVRDVDEPGDLSG